MTATIIHRRTFFSILLWLILVATVSVSALFKPDFGLCRGGVEALGDFDLAKVRVTLLEQEILPKPMKLVLPHSTSVPGTSRPRCPSCLPRPSAAGKCLDDTTTAPSACTRPAPWTSASSSSSAGSPSTGFPTVTATGDRGISS